MDNIWNLHGIYNILNVTNLLEPRPRRNTIKLIIRKKIIITNAWTIESALNIYDRKTRECMTTNTKTRQNKKKKKSLLLL